MGMAQEKENSKKIKLSWMEGLGVSYFHYNVKALNHKINNKSYRFETPNLRIGIVAEVPISQKISIKTGVRIGLRIKRTSIYEDYKLGGTVGSYTFTYLDERVSHSNSSFVEIPVGLQYNASKIKFGISAIYRDFAIFTDALDPMDFGILPNVSVAINNKISIGVEYYFSSYAVSEGIVHDNSGKNINYKSTNRFAQITMEYKLKGNR